MPKTVQAKQEPPRKKTRVNKLSEPSNGFKYKQPEKQKFVRLREQFMPRPQAESKRRVKQVKEKKRTYQNVTDLEVKKMALLRFGNPIDTSRTCMSYQDIGKRVRRPAMTVHSVLRRWLFHNRTKYDGRINNGQHVAAKAKLQGEVKDFLLSKQTLSEWAQHGLEDRCALLETSRGIKVSWQVLRNFYKKHGVRYLFGNYAYQQSLAVKRSLVLDFSVELAQLISDDKVIAYFDESAFNMWIRPRKTWHNPDEPVTIMINKDRGHNVTVYGAIGVRLTKAVFMQGTSTRRDLVVQFMEKLRNESGLPQLTPIHLVLDNHRSHYTKEVTIAMEANNIIPHFMPPYTPEFNCIEALWGWVKKDVKKRMAQSQIVKKTLKQEDFEKLLQSSLNSVSVEQQAHAARYNNRDFMYRVLGECIQREEKPLEFFRAEQQRQEQASEMFEYDPFDIDFNDQVLLGGNIDEYPESDVAVSDMIVGPNTSNRVLENMSEVRIDDSQSNKLSGMFRFKSFAQSKLTGFWKS